MTPTTRQPIVAPPDALTPNLKRPLDRTTMSNDVGALNALLGMLNNPAITGAAVPADENVRAEAAARPAPMDFPPLDPAAAALPVPPAAVPAPAALTLEEPAPVSNKFFFTGQSRAGKHYVAAQLGLPVFATTDALKAFADGFGVKPGAPGAQSFFDTVYQWGRGVITDKYPITPARIMFAEFVRTQGKFPNYGQPNNPLFWLNATLGACADGCVILGITTSEEFQYLQAQGFTHIHVLAAPATRQARGATAAASPTSLASKFDAIVTQQISHVKQGPTLHAVWSDPSIPCPSPRIQSVAQFVNAFKAATTVATGE